MKTLGQRHLIVRYDRPGAGLSGPRRGELSLRDELAYALTVIDDLGLTEFALFGTSCGGPTAVAIAAERPDTVSQLLLYGSNARGDQLAERRAQDVLVEMVESVWGVGIRAITDVCRGVCDESAGAASFDLALPLASDSCERSGSHGYQRRPRAMPLVNVKIIEGVFDAQQKQRIVRDVTEALINIEGENMREVTHVIVEEVRSGNWGIGGRPMTTEDVRALAAGAAVG